MSQLAITAARSYPCPYCTAGVGEQCRTKTGWRATYMHAARFQPIADARHEARRAGYTDALRVAANNPDWWERVRHRYLNKETP